MAQRAPAASAAGAAATPTPAAAKAATPAATTSAAPARPITVTAHSAHSVPSKFASMISPIKASALANPNNSLAPSAASMAAAGGAGGGNGSGSHSHAHSASALSAPGVIIMSPPSGGGGGGGINRFTTMLPSESRQPIPASEAPDAKPDAARVYAGLINGKAGREDARKKYWTAVLAAAPAVPNPKQIDVSSLPSKLLQEIDMELEGGHFSNFSPALTESDFDSIRHVLQCELELSERESYMVGSSHLCARLFVACDRDEARTLAMLVLLESKLRPYTSSTSSSSPLRNDVLMLSDLMQSNPVGSELLGYLSGSNGQDPELSFDLVDLGDVVSTWFAGCFSALFPPEFALRAIDIVLMSKETAGAQACVVGLMLGVLLVSAMQLMQCDNSDALFGFLHELPSTLTKAQMGEVFAHAYWGFQVPQSKGTLNLLRKQADWNKIISQAGPGTIQFQSGGSGGSKGAASSPLMSLRDVLNSTPTSSGSYPSKAAATATTTAAAGGAKGHSGGSASGSFNLAEYSIQAAAARRSIAMREEGAGGGYGYGPVGNSNASGADGASQKTSTGGAASSQVGLTRIGSLPGGAVGGSTTSSPERSDAMLVAELTAATVRTSPAVNTQQLLERALREIKRLDQAGRAAAAAAAGGGGGGGAAGAASAIGGGASSSGLPSDAASAHARAVTASSQQQLAVGVQARDRSGSGNSSGSVLNSNSTAGGLIGLNISGGGGPKKVVPSTGLIRHSELLDYQNFPSLCMQGYLNKSRAPSKLFQRKGSTGFFGNLHRRFFVLQGNFLTYFKTHHDVKPTRDESLDLRCCVASKIKNHEFAPFAFQISLRDKGTLLYLLFADNETIRDVWLEVLSNATQVPAITQ